MACATTTGPVGKPPIPRGSFRRIEGLYEPKMTSGSLLISLGQTVLQVKNPLDSGESYRFARSVDYFFDMKKQSRAYAIHPGCDIGWKIHFNIDLAAAERIIDSQTATDIINAFTVLHENTDYRGYVRGQPDSLSTFLKSSQPASYKAALLLVHLFLRELLPVSLEGRDRLYKTLSGGEEHVKDVTIYPCDLENTIWLADRLAGIQLKLSNRGRTQEFKLIDLLKKFGPKDNTESLVYRYKFALRFQTYNTYLYKDQKGEKGESISSWGRFSIPIMQSDFFLRQKEEPNTCNTINKDLVLALNFFHPVFGTREQIEALWACDRLCRGLPQVPISEFKG